jgi:hypothetical protein
MTPTRQIALSLSLLILVAGFLVYARFHHADSASSPAANAPAPPPRAETLPVTDPPATSAPAPDFAWTPPLPEDQSLDIPALVQHVSDTESWLDHVTSLHLTEDVTWTNSPESLDHRRREIQNEFPGQSIEDKNFRELTPISHQHIEVAFDARRIFREETDDFSRDTYVFDGNQQRDFHWEPDSPSSFQQSLSNHNERLTNLNHMIGNWPVTPHHLWFERATDPPQRPAPDQEFRYLGRARFEDMDCLVLQQYNTTALLRWYIGISDHQLHRILIGSNSPADSVLFEFAAAHGRQFTTREEFDRWLETLPAAEQSKPYQDPEWTWKSHLLLRPSAELVYGDYAEVAPDCLLPRRIRFTSFVTANASPVIPDHWYTDFHYDKTVTAITLNLPLPDSLFHHAFVQGEPLYDATQTPETEYFFRDPMPPGELAKAIENSRRMRAPDVFSGAAAKARKALLGKPVPPLPANTRWLKSPPLTWETLRGKPLLVEFVAEWCVPSARFDLPRLAAIHDDRATNNVQVLLIHVPGSTDAAIEQFLTTYKLSCPLCIDLPAAPAAADPSSTPWGQIADAFHVDRLPMTFFIDAEGIIRAQGVLYQCTSEAQNRGDLPPDPLLIPSSRTRPPGGGG